MNKSTCTEIRRELDEMLLGEDCSAQLSAHLSDCDACRDFFQKQTKLRQIVGSLGTVSAPADFEFRLRSRLAQESSPIRYSGLPGFFGPKAAVLTAVLLLIFGIAIFVRYGVGSKMNPTTVAKSHLQPPKESPQPAQATQPKVVRETVAITQPAADKGNKRIRVRPTRSTVAEDFSSERATVVRDSSSSQPPDTVFPVDALHQSLRVSLSDRRGNSRTIDLPTVSFGSQRVVPSATSFAPKGVW